MASSRLGVRRDALGSSSAPAGLGCAWNPHCRDGAGLSCFRGAEACAPSSVAHTVYLDPPPGVLHPLRGASLAVAGPNGFGLVPTSVSSSLRPGLLESCGVASAGSVTGKGHHGDWSWRKPTGEPWRSCLGAVSRIAMDRGPGATVSGLHVARDRLLSSDRGLPARVCLRDSFVLSDFQSSLHLPTTCLLRGPASNSGSRSVSGGGVAGFLLNPPSLFLPVNSEGQFLPPHSPLLLPQIWSQT